ncbi:hypothetical protein Pen01_50900 [Phytomonospora endophytica]|nr:hypothetical protein Pen01_50900 [Phytomonospora endophytica]
MKRTLSITLLAVLAMGAVSSPVYASADGLTVASQGAGVGTPGGADSALAACTNRITRFGYSGCMSDGTQPADCPWDESFVIAPDRTIWHAWPRSGGWKEMPNYGKADFATNCYYNGNNKHQIDVWVQYTGAYYYSYHSGGAWHGWYRN